MMPTTLLRRNEARDVALVGERWRLPLDRLGDAVVGGEDDLARPPQHGIERVVCRVEPGVDLVHYRDPSYVGGSQPQHRSRPGLVVATMSPGNLLLGSSMARSETH
jgi:hypothetical protein